MKEQLKYEKKYFVQCYAPWLKDGIYAVTNLGIEISVYIQMFILVRVAFFLEGIQTIQFSHKKNNKKTGILMKPTKNLVIIASSLWARN